VSGNANLFARLATGFPADRSRVFLEAEDGSELTFAELLDRAGRIASLLVASGVEPGDRVAVQVEKSVASIGLYLGVLQAGAVYVPLNPAYTPPELTHFIGDAEPKVIVCDPASEGAIAPLVGKAWLFTLGSAGEGTLLAQAAKLPSERDVVARSGDDLAAILYTSGTTGRSKGAMLTSDNLWSNATTLHRFWGFQPDDVLVHALPLFHTHGLFVALNVMLLNGGRMIFLPKFDPERVIGLLPRATVMMGVPTFYTRMLASPSLTREATAGMRLFISGSAPLLAATHEAFEARTGQRILERYGMTETSMSTSNPLKGERRAGTVGPALPGVETRVADAEGAILGPEETGVLEVRGPNVFKGYWRLPEKTAEEMRDGGWFVTGDVARIAADGYVTIVGRAKDLIITGGLNVYPKEVETALDALPGVVESAVVGVPHPDFGEAVVAVLTVSNDPGDVVATLREQLAAFKLPKHVAVVDELPRNAMGKVQKNLLRERFAGLFGPA
jgi:malonyl-CoA/methylmalonyl-CoA synthetase